MWYRLINLQTEEITEENLTIEQLNFKLFSKPIMFKKHDKQNLKQNKAAPPKKGAAPHVIASDFARRQAGFDKFYGQHIAPRIKASGGKDSDCRFNRTPI